MTEPRLHHVACQSPAGDHRMAYWQWGDLQAPQVVMCVHGLSRQGRDFDTLARAFVGASAGAVRVVCPDVVGRGHSEWLADPNGYAVPTYVADMLTLMKALDAQAPVAWFDWVGTSMGGLIGMAVCGTPDLPLPAPVRRLVLNDVGPVIEWSALQRIGGYLGRGGRYDTLQHAADAMAAISAGFGPHTPQQWLDLTQPMVRPLPEGGFGLHYDPAIAVPLRQLTQQDCAQGETTLWALYDRIRADTLLLRGAQSDLLTRETAQAMTTRGPRARLIEFEGVGHAPTLVTPQQIEPLVSFVLGQDISHEKPGGRSG
jgi:pimeloyl-ACP methyl ester carboxylesterase